MIHLSCRYFSPGGWGVIARGMAQALDRLAPVVVHPWDHEAASTRWDLEEGPGIGLGPWEQMPSTLGRPRAAAVVTETTRVPAARLALVEGADQVWAPTAWGVRVLEASGVEAERLRVVPYGVDAERFRPGTRRRGGRFRFLAVGKWERCKGLPLLVRAFCREFTHRDPVELCLLSHNPYRPDLDLDAEIARVVREEGADPPPIRRLDPVPDERLPALYRGADAFVLPTRGEGWGLPILEAMASGLPVLVTDHGAHRAFARLETAYPIRVARMCPVDDPIFYDPRLDWGEWAEPDEAHLRHLMRHVATRREEAAERGGAARREALRWSWARAAEIGLRELNASHPAG